MKSSKEVEVQVRRWASKGGGSVICGRSGYTLDGTNYIAYPEGIGYSEISKIQVMKQCKIKPVKIADGAHAGKALRFSLI